MQIDAPPDGIRGVTFGWKKHIYLNKSIIFLLICVIKNKRCASGGIALRSALGPSQIGSGEVGSTKIGTSQVCLGEISA
jgi:hypothetical protein